MILYAMLYGRYPFDAKEPRFARKIVAAEYTLLPVRADAAHSLAWSLLRALPMLWSDCCGSMA